MCPVENCCKDFARRSNLKDHLIRKHKLSKADASTTCIKSSSTGVSTSTAYSDISDDDSVLDMVAEIDNIMYNTKFESLDNESVIDEWIINDDKDSNTQDEINTVESEESIKCEDQDHDDADFTTNNVTDIEESSENKI